MKKFTLYIPLIGGIICIVLAILLVIYTYTMTEPSWDTFCKMFATWLLLIGLSFRLIVEFISDIEGISYWKGHDRGYDDAKKDIPF